MVNNQFKQRLHKLPAEILTKIARIDELDRLMRFKKIERIGMGRNTRYKRI